MAVAENGPGHGAIVLIGFGEAYAAIETAWSLQAAGYRVVMFGGRRGGRACTLRRVPHVELREVTAPRARRTAPSPTWALWSRRVAAGRVLTRSTIARCGSPAARRDHVTVAGPTGSAVEFALDKDLQIGAAREAGL